MKHIIIPTDFSLRSLEPIRAAITHFAGEPLTVTLLHLLEPPTDILDGLRLAYRSDVEPAVPRAFGLAVESVAAVYEGHIQAIRTKISYGSTTAVMRNLLEHLGADAILFDPAIPFEQPSPASIDARPLLRRAMPRIVVETGAIQQPSVPAPSAVVREAPAQRNTAPKPRLQPAANSRAEAHSS